MIEIEVITIVPADIDKVFERLVDLPGYRAWLPDSTTHRSCEVTSQLPIQAGSTYVDYGTSGTFVGEVVEYLPPTKVVFRQRFEKFGMLVFEAVQTNTLEPDGGGTKVLHHFTGVPHGVFKLMKPMMRKQATQERNRIFIALKGSFE